MKDYILSLLIGNNPSVFASWGASDMGEIYGNDLFFHVNGFMFTGYVHIIYNEGKNLFDVELIGEGTLELTKRIEELYLDQLRDILDKEIERGSMSDEEYSKKCNEYLYNFIFS